MLKICVGHVDFKLFVSLLFTLGTQRECAFWWNMCYIQYQEIRDLLL